LGAVDTAPSTGQQSPAKKGPAARGQVVWRDPPRQSPAAAPGVPQSLSSLARTGRPAGLLGRPAGTCERLRGFRHHWTTRTRPCTHAR